MLDNIFFQTFPRIWNICSSNGHIRRVSEIQNFQQEGLGRRARHSQGNVDGRVDLAKRDRARGAAARRDNYHQSDGTRRAKHIERERAWRDCHIKGAAKYIEWNVAREANNDQGDPIISRCANLLQGNSARRANQIDGDWARRFNHVQRESIIPGRANHIKGGLDRRANSIERDEARSSNHIQE